MRELCGSAPGGNRAFKQCCQHSDFCPRPKANSGGPVVTQQSPRAAVRGRAETSSPPSPYCGSLMREVAAGWFICKNRSLHWTHFLFLFYFFKSPMTLFISPTAPITAKCTSLVKQFKWWRNLVTSSDFPYWGVHSSELQLSVWLCWGPTEMSSVINFSFYVTPHYELRFANIS